MSVAQFSYLPGRQFGWKIDLFVNKAACPGQADKQYFEPCKILLCYTFSFSFVSLYTNRSISPKISIIAICHISFLLSTCLYLALMQVCQLPDSWEIVVSFASEASRLPGKESILTIKYGTHFDKDTYQWSGYIYDFFIYISEVP